MTATSPVQLNYAAALRGVVPLPLSSGFRYLDATCTDTFYLTCLAASNPEGIFTGLVDLGKASTANVKAKALGVDNVRFVETSIEEFVAARAQTTTQEPAFHILVADESDVALPETQHNALLEAAETLLMPEGIFNYRYSSFGKGQDPLAFMVNEFAPEIPVDQKLEFLVELKTLGQLYFKENPAKLITLDSALASGNALPFFDMFKNQTARSSAFATALALKNGQFRYAGDSRVAANYLELSVPKNAQDLVIACNHNPLYEAIKDFTMNRAVRSDIWVKAGAETTEHTPTLMGPFSFGIMTPREEIPTEMSVNGKAIPLDSVLYTKLIDLLCLTPASIGDIMSYPECSVFEANDIVGALQILVACGIAQPMRGLTSSPRIETIATPKFAGSFNKNLGDEMLVKPEARLASTVVGAPVVIHLRDALVMRALDQVGLANSPGALRLELDRIAANPQLCNFVEAKTMDDASVKSMVEGAVRKSIVQWISYGLLNVA